MSIPHLKCTPKAGFRALYEPDPFACNHKPQKSIVHKTFISLCNQLNNTTSFLDLSLGLLADPSCSYNQRNLWDATLAEDFRVAEGEKVKDGSGIGFLAGDVLVAGLFRDQ